MLVCRRSTRRSNRPSVKQQDRCFGGGNRGCFLCLFLLDLFLNLFIFAIVVRIHSHAAWVVVGGMHRRRARGKEEVAGYTFMTTGVEIVIHSEVSL